ncbi:MAG: c-type cytochrome [Rhodoferax sp.]|nr:c-type cytochrome [Rhodoferax sp.]
MSTTHTPSDHDAHGAPAPSASKKIISILALAVVPVLLVVWLINQYKVADGQGTPSSMSEEATATRIQKVGVLSLGAASSAPKTGEQVFKAQCTTCHTAGLVGAPKFGDAAAWAPRIKTGYDALLNSALKGKGNMTPQGGGAFSDDEVARAMVYMANAGGAKFEEPAAPAGAAAPAPEAAVSQ